MAMPLLLFPLVSWCIMSTMPLVQFPPVSALNSVASYPSCLNKFPAVFNFGDSNSDTGGFASAFGPSVDPSPNGVTFFSNPSGRACDGRLVVDFLSEALGLSYLNAYLDSIGSNFTNGANFATAGSSIFPQNMSAFQPGGFISPFSLGVQVTQFIQFKKKTTEYYRQETYSHVLPKPDYFTKGLYILDIAQNDLAAGLFGGLTVRQVKGNIPQLLQYFTTYVKVLYEEGARNFLIMKTGPLGCLPYVLVGLRYRLSDLDFHGCVRPYNNVAKFYNFALEVAVSKLRQDLSSATFVLTDNFKHKYGLLQNAHKNGFRFTVRACCGYGGGPYNYRNNVFCGSKGSNVCKDPSVYVNWDGMHYTESANRILASGILSYGYYSSPSFSGGATLCDLYPAKA